MRLFPQSAILHGCRRRNAELDPQQAGYARAHAFCRSATGLYAVITHPHALLRLRRWALQRDVNQGLSLGGELFARRCQFTGPRYADRNFGGIYTRAAVRDARSCFAGHSISANATRGYLALYWDIGPQ